VETSEDGGLFRVTPFGRYALDAGPAPTEGEPEYGPSLVVQPDFEVLAYLDRCAPGVRRKLDVSCERVRGGTVATYRLTKEALYRSLRNGMQPGRFMELLTRNAMRPIPDNIREQIASWERRLDAITLRTRCELLEYLDAEAAREFAEANPGSRQIGDRFVLLAGPPKEGPITHIDYRQPLRRFLQQEKGLQFRVPWQRSSLFVRRMLGGIADLERARTGDLMVTLNRRRFNGSDDWSLVAAELEALSEGPLAPRYRLALRAWAGEVNPVMSGSATLLRFDDPEVCEAVMEQPSVTPLIEGRLGLYTLVVRPGSLTTLKRLMKEQGITVTPGDSLVDPGSPEAWLEDYTRRRQAPDPEDPPEDVSKRQEATASDEGEMLPSYSPRIVREILEDAIQRRHPVLIAYQSAWNPRPTTRKVNPVSLDVTSRTPALSGYCHLHGGARSFKLAQIAGIRVLEDDTF